MPTPYTRPIPPNGPGTCPRCHEPVIWCLNANRNTQAVNAQRVDYGNQAVRQDGAGRWHTRQLTKDRPILEGSEALYYPHAPTCTNPAPRAPRVPVPRGRQGVRPTPWRQR
ncbi:MAG: hypothetical protein HOZ81_28000 [Streptomyces sp.]|nr:hypothetical protein [Streptomyces sp.]